MTPETEFGDTQLWAAVINQALADSVFTEKKYAHEMRKARNWFIRGGKDFREVCAYAGVQHERVRAYALQKIKEADAKAGAERAPKIPKMLEFNGETRSLTDWAAITGIRYSVIHDRLKRGRTPEETLTPGTRPKPKKLHAHDGQSHTVVDWAKITGISKTTIQHRINAGWSLADALTISKQEALTRRLQNARAAVKKPRGAKAKLYVVNGVSKTLQAWADHLGMSPFALRNRIKQGWSLERALTQPSRQAPKSKAPIAKAA
jgi:hypothetical protein